MLLLHRPLESHGPTREPAGGRGHARQVGLRRRGLPRQQGLLAVERTRGLRLPLLGRGGRRLRPDLRRRKGQYQDLEPLVALNQ